MDMKPKGVSVQPINQIQGDQERGERGGGELGARGAGIERSRREARGREDGVEPLEAGDEGRETFGGAVAKERGPLEEEDDESGHEP